MKALSIKAAGDCDFDAFAFAEEHGGVFHQPAIREVGGSQVELFIIHDESGQALGGFNLQRIRLKGIASWGQITFHPHCALFTLPLEGKMPALVSKKKKVLEAISFFLHSLREKVIYFPLPPEWQDVQVLDWGGFKCSIRYTYRLDLHEEDPLKDLSSKVKGHVRSARESGAELSHEVSEEEFLTCMASTAKHQGFDLRGESLRRLFQAAQAPNGQVYGVRLQGELVAAGLFVEDREVRYYLMGGLSREHALRGSLALLLVQAISDSKERGLKIFDFEGSMIPGVEQFFRSFGGKPTPYYLATTAPSVLKPLFRLRGRREF